MNASPEATPPTRGLVAGKYQLSRRIGKGGMGSVWEGQHFKLGTKVAIKFIETEHAVSAEARARFEKEAVAAATIQSKHAIQIFDHGVTEEGIPYIVMEMLSGESLERRVERMNRLSLQETAKFLLQVSRALAHAHKNGIIHRDLKPDNVFIVRDSDDGEEMAKVLDFGIAKVQGAPGNPGMTSSTKTGAVLGTPFYMSPEQARGLRNVDHRTDIWSLGVIAFRCVTGRLPFDGESVGDLLVKICTAPPPVPSQVAPGIPSGFDGWFMRTMEREPERRFASVLDQANELCSVAGIGAPMSHQPMSHQQTAAVSSGVPTPNGMLGSGPRTGPPIPQGASAYGPMTQPSGPGAQSNPAFAQPGFVTNAPYTSDSIAGLPSRGNGKVVGLVVGALLLGMAIAGGGYIVATRKPPEPAVASSAPPPASSVVPEPKVEAKIEPKPIESAEPKPAAEVPPPHKGKPVVVAPSAKPAPQPVAKPAAPPAPAPPPPAPPPPPKPINKDPGY